MLYDKSQGTKYRMKENLFKTIQSIIFYIGTAIVTCFLVYSIRSCDQTKQYYDYKLEKDKINQIVPKGDEK